VRSSARIPKEIPILLIGSDLDGRVFSEHTKTVLLSLHGAGIFSRHKLSSEQELVLRLPERNKEAEIRVVGHIGSNADGHTYGVAFFDPHLNFWEIDFPAISSAERELGLLSIVCSSCNILEKIDDSGIEADVFATNDSLQRFCKRCGASTLWKPAANGSPAPQSAPEPASAGTGQMPLFSPIPNSAPTPPPASPAPPPVPPATAPSFYAQMHNPKSASSPSPASSSVHSESRWDPQPTVLTLPVSEQSVVPRVNRRKHARIKVNYSACVRHPHRDGDDIVLCEDMSKGGLRFKSRKEYCQQSLIEVAVPYVPGQPPIFVPAQIVFVQALPEQELFRCGVAYLQPAKPPASF
jgi:hypothetical protein